MRPVRCTFRFILLFIAGMVVAGCEAPDQAGQAGRVIAAARYSAGMAGPIGRYSTAILKVKDPALIDGAATTDASRRYGEISRSVQRAADDAAAIEPAGHIAADHDDVVAAMRRVARRLAAAERHARAGDSVQVARAMGGLPQDELRVTRALQRLGSNQGVHIKGLVGPLTGQ